MRASLLPLAIALRTLGYFVILLICGFIYDVGVVVFCCSFVSFLMSRPTPAAAPVVQELSPYEEYMASR